MVVGNDSELDYGVTVGRIEASCPDSKLRVGIRSSDGTHRRFFPGFGAPSWNTEFRWDASTLLFRIRSSELEYGVPMGRIDASFSVFEAPSWNTKSRWDASTLLFRIRSSEFDFGVPVRRT